MFIYLASKEAEYENSSNRITFSAHNHQQEGKKTEGNSWIFLFVFPKMNSLSSFLYFSSIVFTLTYRRTVEKNATREKQEKQVSGEFMDRRFWWKLKCVGLIFIIFFLGAKVSLLSKSRKKHPCLLPNPGRIAFLGTEDELNEY